jgi:hypothetical protein
MANSASLLLPGSNLTNLLVLRDDPQNGASFASHMLPAWISACGESPSLAEPGRGFEGIGRVECG